MTDEITPESTDASPAADPSGQAAPDPSLKIKELEQRLRGLDAKVTAVAKERDTLQSKVSALESGQIDADATLKAQLQARDSELAELRTKAAALPKVTKFPHAAQILGEDIANVSDERLVDMEAQLSQAPAPVEDTPKARPTPVPANGPDTDGGSYAGMTREQILAEIGRLPSPFSN